MSVGERRVGINESLFRGVNERIEELSRESDAEMDFMCECADPSCYARLTLPLRQSANEQEPSATRHS